MKTIVFICFAALMIAISYMPQRDEADKACPAGCVAGNNEVASNQNGACEIHTRLHYAQAQVPTLTCPVDGQCTDDTLTPASKP